MKIILAVDDVRSAGIASQALIAQFKTGNTEVRLVHAIEPYPVDLAEQMGGKEFPDFLNARARQRERLQKAFAATCDQLRSAGFQVDSTCHDGDPRDVILDCAREWHADLIVLCAHSRKGIERFLLGSVSEAVARHAHCSVEIIRMPSGQ